jgi:hypothetical protein
MTLVDQCCKRGRLFRRSQKIGRSHHRHRPGRDVFPAGRGNPGVSLCSLRGDLLFRPVELGPVDPHPMQNNGELARNGDLCFAEPVALGDLTRVIESQGATAGLRNESACAEAERRLAGRAPRHARRIAGSDGSISG